VAVANQEIGVPTVCGETRFELRDSAVTTGGVLVGVVVDTSAENALKSPTAS